MILLFSVKFTNVQDWKMVFSSLEKSFEEGIFQTSENVVVFRTIHSSNIALLEVAFPRSSFKFLKVSNLSFKFLIEELKVILTHANQNDSIEFQMQNDKFLNVYINKVLIAKLTVQKIHDLKNFEPPKIEYTSMIHLGSDVIKKILANFKNNYDCIQINSKKNVIQFSSLYENKTSKINIDEKNTGLYEVQIINNTSSTYSLEYMKDIIRNIGKTCKTMKMEYSSSRPLRLSFVTSSNAQIEYYLAPRIVYQ